MTLKATLAVLVVTFSSGCGLSNEPVEVSLANPLPALPEHLSSDCSVNPLTGEAIPDLARERLSSAECRRKHRRLVTFYENLRLSSGPN